MSTRASGYYAALASPRVRVASDQYAVDPNDVVVTYRYQNRTDHPITVSRRDGTRFLVMPTEKLNCTGQFSVFVTYSCKRTVISECLNQLNAVLGTNAEMETVAKALLRNFNRTTATVVNATVEYMLSEDELTQQGGRVYLTDVDVMVEHTGGRVVPHPFSRDSQNRSALQALLPAAGPNTFAFMLKAVDNSYRKHFSDRYINLGGKVYQIPVEEDESLSTGVHVISRVPVSRDRRDNEGELCSTRMDFEQADELFHLHTTVEQAELGGPPSEMLKEKLNERLARQRLEELDIKDRTTVKELELQQLRTQTARNKAEQEQEQSTVRNVLEWVKVGSAIFATTLSLLTIWQKYSTR